MQQRLSFMIQDCGALAASYAGNALDCFLYVARMCAYATRCTPRCAAASAATTDVPGGGGGGGTMSAFARLSMKCVAKGGHQRVAVCASCVSATAAMHNNTHHPLAPKYTCAPQTDKHNAR